MLIIFDLDDTLIDTSGSVTPFKMRECLKRLVEDGLRVRDFDEAYAELLAINAESARSKDALASMIAKGGLAPERASRALAELTAPLPPDFRIPTTPQANEILTFFHSFHTLALVTGGHSSFQREKMEKAGLDSSIFSRIAIPEDCIKKPVYEVLAKDFSTAPERVWVCGDRLEMDLAPARELGFKTIHMRWGRGKKARADWVDHSISVLAELKGIIK